MKSFASTFSNKFWKLKLGAKHLAALGNIAPEHMVRSHTQLSACLGLCAPANTSDANLDCATKVASEWALWT